jgi:hypothetical protein
MPSPKPRPAGGAPSAVRRRGFAAAGFVATRHDVDTIDIPAKAVIQKHLAR